MNAPQPNPPIIGTPFAGGLYAGQLRIDGQLHALILAPKAEGEHKPATWIPGNKDVPGAKSYFDGMGNTIAMAEAGSKLAKWALDLRISGFDDWYIPSQDELELCYRAFKPTTDDNWCYARSGINLSAEPPSYPYTPEFPTQTALPEFQKDGAEAFDPAWYRTSTQHASVPDWAWYQYFYDGRQYDLIKGIKLRARAVRRLAI